MINNDDESVWRLIFKAATPKYIAIASFILVGFWAWFWLVYLALEITK